MTEQSFEFHTTALPQADDSSCAKEPEVSTALICDNSLLRTGLQRILSGTPFALVEDGPATDPRPGSEGGQEAKLVILAVGQPSPHTPKMVRQAKERHPAARIVLLADHVDLALVTQGREAGVDGFCLTGSSREVLFTTLEMVMLGESMVPGAVVRSIIESMAPSPELEPASKVSDQPGALDPGSRSLSAREAEILRSLMEGTPNKLIARKLHVTEATVKVHVKAVLRKIGVANRTQAAMWAKGHLHA
jgi:two-component system, NarL family, nitrate/nitrite response regulator NarL